MVDTSRENQADYLDVSATALKQTMGHILEQAYRGERIRITRHGRTDERLVILREDDLRRLEAQQRAPLDTLTAEFDDLIAAMQTPTARQAAASVGTASTEALAWAAVKGNRQGD